MTEQAVPTAVDHPCHLGISARSRAHSPDRHRFSCAPTVSVQSLSIGGPTCDSFSIENAPFTFPTAYRPHRLPAPPITGLYRSTGKAQASCRRSTNRQSDRRLLPRQRSSAAMAPAAKTCCNSSERLSAGRLEPIRNHDRLATAESCLHDRMSAIRRCHEKKISTLANGYFTPVIKASGACRIARHEIPGIR